MSSKRNITVDGVLYEYVVGTQFVRIKNVDTHHVWLVDKEEIGEWVEDQWLETKLAVKPSHIKTFIQGKTNEAV